VKVGDEKKNANIHNSAFYYTVNKLKRMRGATNGTRKRDCRFIVNVDAVANAGFDADANAVDASISHSGKGR
jgi:hypothetical protein